MMTISWGSSDCERLLCVECKGLDPWRPYVYDPRSEALEDDEGYDINWRT